MSDADSSPYKTNTISALSALSGISSAFPSVNNVKNEPKIIHDGKQSENTNTYDQKTLTFPSKLMAMLSNEEHAKVIAWLPHGKIFCIYNKKDFVETVLPRYFNNSKFTSFTKQLRRWRFTRLPNGRKVSAYHHNLFQRNNKALCMQMSCLPRVTSKKRKANSFPSTPILPSLGMTQVPTTMTATSTFTPPTLMNIIAQSQLSQQQISQHNTHLQNSFESSFRIYREQNMLQQELRNLMISRLNAMIALGIQAIPGNYVDVIETGKNLNYNFHESEDASFVQDQIRWLDTEIAEIHDARFQQI